MKRVRATAKNMSEAEKAAEQLVLFLPARLYCPGKDLLEMVAVVHGWCERRVLIVDS